ncbi:MULTISPECIES: carbohydrate kinase [Streptomyces]|uniref:carbohydrate kinase family protein n=1 Tax=Streptomyces TaxID=1883 RepID=UPI0004C99D64|nr:MULTISPECIES: carbohydrate kinase [Streptomyces]MDX3607490.1 carbohydrate kinase [Streptomyces sp. FL06-04B]MDX3736238.1 carbohydrate kinase [Streptomyces sp. ID01-15D]
MTDTSPPGPGRDPGSVLVLGEALVDLVPADEDIAVRVAQPGGAPANVAVGLARLGGRPSFVGGLGDDAFGSRIEAWLTGAGVDLSLSARPPLPTALAVADPGDHGNTYRFHLGDTATFALPDRTAEATRFGAVYVGGLAAVVEPAAEVVAATARAAHGGVLAVDPNVREDRTLDPVRSLERLRELCALARVVKASDEDLVRLWPDAEPEASCRRLAGQGRLVVLTRGARGATAYVQDAPAVSVPALAVRVVNTIGAGDAFMAGMLAWLGSETGWRTELSRTEARAMLEYAAATAASVCARAGTEPTAPLGV